MNIFKRGVAIICVLLAIFTMPAVAANATSLANITVTAQSTAAGTNATYVMNLTNNGTSGGDSYYINISNPNSASVASANITFPVYVAQDASRIFNLNVTNTSSGTFYVNVTVISVNDTTKSMSVNTTTTVTAVRAVNFTNITATSGASTQAGTNYSFTLILTNNGTDPDTYSLTVENVNVASVANINTSSVYLTVGANKYITLNVTNTTAGAQYQVNVTAVSANDSTKSGFVNTSIAVYDLPSITTYSPDTPVTDANAVISRIFNVTVNQSATVTYYINGTNVGSTVGTIVTYTNSTPSLGTWNVSAIATTSAGSAIQTWTWIVPSSTISSVAVVTGTGASDRVINSANVSLNFTLTDSGNISTINLTFPSTFKFSALLTANVSTGLGTCTLTLTATVVSCYNATGLNNSATHINLTVNVTTPSASGTNNITVSTNKNTTGVIVPLYVRDSTRPFYVKSNNSVFTVASETFGASTTTITLTGTGVANLTLYAPNITGQTNITVGYGATYVDSIRTYHTPATNPNNTIYLITNGTIANPVIVVSSDESFWSANLPAAITATGVISGLTIAYAYLRRRRRHP